MLTKLSVMSIIAIMVICPATVLVTPTDADSDIVYKGTEIYLTYEILPAVSAMENTGVFLPAYADQVDFGYFKQMIVAAMDNAPEGVDLTEYRVIADAMEYDDLEFRKYSASEAAELKEEISNSIYSEFSKSEINAGAVAAGLASVITLLSVGAICVYKRP